MQKFPYLLILLFVSKVANARPIFFFHGLGISCAEMASYEDKDCICIKTGENGLTSAYSIFDQAKTGCKELTKKIFPKSGNTPLPKFQAGFTLVGWSQGGLIARLVFQTCAKIRPLIKRLYTFGTPNLGIESLPIIEPNFGGSVSSAIKVMNRVIE